MVYRKYNSKELDKKKLEGIDEFVNDKQENKVKWLI